MKSRVRRKPLRLVVEDGEPAAVILGIEEYRQLLERLEDVEDLKMLERMRKKPLRFKKLEAFIAEYSSGV